MGQCIGASKATKHEMGRGEWYWKTE